MIVKRSVGQITKVVEKDSAEEKEARAQVEKRVVVCDKCGTPSMLSDGEKNIKHCCGPKTPTN